MDAPTDVTPVGHDSTARPLPLERTPETKLYGTILFPVYHPGYYPLATYDLWAVEADGSDFRLFMERAHQPAFDVNRQQLLVVLERPGEAEYIARVSIDRSNLWQVSNNSGDSQPSWSPDGTAFVFSFPTGRVPEIGIVWDLNRRERHPIRFLGISATEIVLGELAFWMSDDWIVLKTCSYGIDEGGGKCGLYKVGSRGTVPPVQLTQHVSDTAPNESDGRIAFMSARYGQWDIFMVDDSGALKRLTSDIAADGLPTFSPDGRHIAFVSDRDGEWAIWVMEADGQNQTKLCALGGPPGPDWPGERLAWIGLSRQ